MIEKRNKVKDKKKDNKKYPYKKIGRKTLNTLLTTTHYED